MKEVVEKSKPLSGKKWVKTYKAADRLTKIAMLSRSLWANKIASYNYGYLSYLYSDKYVEYYKLERKAIEKELEKV